MPEALSLRPSSYCRALILQLLLVQLLLPFHRWPRHGFFVAEASVVVKSPWYGETGNRVRTVVKGMQLAQHLGTDVTFPELWLLKHRRFSFGPSAAANLTISGRAAYKLPESPRDPRGLGAYRHFDGAAINERLRGSLVDELQHVDPLPATHLVIHVRGGRGLFFTAKAIPIEPKYAQPPFSFYKRVIEEGMAVDDDSEEDAQGNRRTGRRQPWTEVTVVSQDRSNPVVELIVSSPWPTLARPPTLRVDKSLRDDYRFLLSARSLAYGHGSFMVFLVQLSRNAERTYFSAPTSLGGGYVDCRFSDECIPMRKLFDQMQLVIRALNQFFYFRSVALPIQQVA